MCLDGAFATPRLLGYLEAMGVEYLAGFPENLRLDKRIRRLLGRVRMLSKDATESWKRKRRIAMKAEVTQHEGRKSRDKPRYVVTKMPGAPEAVYDVYRMRGEMENRIKELHHGLEMDRTSCTSFKASHLRVLMTAAAFVLMQEMRRLLAGAE